MDTYKPATVNADVELKLLTDDIDFSIKATKNSPVLVVPGSDNLMGKFQGYDVLIPANKVTFNG